MHQPTLLFMPLTHDLEQHQSIKQSWSPQLQQAASFNLGQQQQQ